MATHTKSTRPVRAKQITRSWHLIDLKDEVLGRTATQISVWLTGKHKRDYVEHLDQGDYVVAINAGEVRITGNKKNQKVYTKYSGYPGGLKSRSFKEMMSRNPKVVIRHAISGMLPKNKHRDKRLTRLFVYTDFNHPYSSKFEKKTS